MAARSQDFRYLNREGKWLDFHWHGLELTPDGSLQLRSAPRLIVPPSPNSATSAPDAPGGVAVDGTGRIFWSMPSQHRIVVRGDCDPEPSPLLCLSERAGLGPLDSPRGLLVLQEPERLVIVDSGQHRLLFCDLIEFEVREVWGRTSLSGWPVASQDFDGFDTPWVVAADADGQNIFVLDAGNRRVVKRARTGEADVQFTEYIRRSGLISQPSALAVSGAGTDTRVLVADAVSGAIFAFDYTGEPIRDADGRPVAIRWPGTGGVLALAAGDGVIYVGDNDQRRILTFANADGYPFCGEAAGFHDAVAALAVDPHGHSLLVQTGDGDDAPLSLAERSAYIQSAVLWSDAISGGSSGVKWNRLRSWIVDAPGANVEFYYAVADSPETPAVDPAAEQPFGAAVWQALPRGVEDCLLEGSAARYLFVGVQFSGDRSGTPRLQQMRADFNGESITRYLPAIYREADHQPEFLRKLASLFQGLFEDVEQEVETLERYFDPFAAPVEALPWLASWLALDIEQGESQARIRSSIAGAFHRYRWRGTVEGLRLALLEQAGVHAIISEPIVAASFAVMQPAGDAGTAAGLGISAHLSSVQPGGAVLDSTATLDGSYLITDAEFGAPLFAGTAWQFVVEIHQREAATDARLKFIREIIDREKPAHTMYRLSLIEPRMRVGFQARLGIDSFVGGTPGPRGLGERGGEDGVRLTGLATPRIGASRLGSDIHIS
jgi:phage tail-like protein